MGRHRLQFHSATISTAFAFLLFSSALCSTQQPDGSRSDQRETAAVAGGSGRGSNGGNSQRRVAGVGVTEELERVTRRLIGPGSSPPSCRSKCGRCLPCRAVHVPIQPGLSKPLEYYPEAWRCKCGNNLFMP